MKKVFFLFLFVFCLSACSAIEFNFTGNATEELEQGSDCYGEEIHPAAQSISDDFYEIVDYNTVMNWFCNGAEFEDIMNALLTEEMVGSGAEGLLRRIAEGENWNDIWLDLDIVDE